MNNHHYRVICLVARQGGVKLLTCLLRHPNITVVGVFTHSKRPRSEDPNRTERPEFLQMRKLLEGINIPLYAVDSLSEAKRMEGFEELGEFDFLLSLSWRFLVHPHILGRSRLADINLHRGLLPRYSGAEPVRRMLEDGLKQATITAHIMVDAIDAGEILQEDNLEMRIMSGEALPAAIERIKKSLESIYPLTAVKAMNQILKRKGLPQISVELPRS